jgi:hypothetical protein
MKETSQSNRNAMSIIAIVIGLVMAYVIPFLPQTSLERVLIHLTAHNKEGFPCNACNGETQEMVDGGHLLFCGDS